MKQKLIKVGHSLMVVVPSAFARAVGAKPKDYVNVLTNQAKAEIILKFSSISQLGLGDEFFK